MNKIEKFLRKLRQKEREAILLIMTQLKQDFRKIPHLKPLVGKENWYRIKVGNYRIIFVVKNKQVEIMRITKTNAYL